MTYRVRLVADVHVAELGDVEFIFREARPTLGRLLVVQTGPAETLHTQVVRQSKSRIMYRLVRLKATQTDYLANRLMLPGYGVNTPKWGILAAGHTAASYTSRIMLLCDFTSGVGCDRK